MPGDLLQTKLYVPRLRLSLVPRPHLVEKLNVGLAGKLTLISAPAGFGKTTLVSEWIAGCKRPFDDQSQERIRLESEAVLLILTRVQNDDWEWCKSDVVLEEIEQTPDSKRRERVMQLNTHVSDVYHISETDIVRAGELADLGFSSMDALHIACAESCGADVLLTTDDRLIRRVTSLAEQLQVVVENPLNWLVRQHEIES